MLVILTKDLNFDVGGPVKYIALWVWPFLWPFGCFRAIFTSRGKILWPLWPLWPGASFLKDVASIWPSLFLSLQSVFYLEKCSLNGKSLWPFWPLRPQASFLKNVASTWSSLPLSLLPVAYLEKCSLNGKCLWPFWPLWPQASFLNNVASTWSSLPLSLLPVAYFEKCSLNVSLSHCFCDLQLKYCLSSQVLSFTHDLLYVKISI